MFLVIGDCLTFVVAALLFQRIDKLMIDFIAA